MIDVSLFRFLRRKRALDVDSIQETVDGGTTESVRHMTKLTAGAQRGRLDSRWWGMPVEDSDSRRLVSALESAQVHRLRLRATAFFVICIFALWVCRHLWPSCSCRDHSGNDVSPHGIMVHIIKHLNFHADLLTRPSLVVHMSAPAVVIASVRAWVRKSVSPRRR